MTSKKNKFNQAAQQQASRRFDYAREVRQVWRDFPETRDKLFFLDLCAAEMLVYPDLPKRKKAVRKWMNDNKNLQSAAENFRTVEKSSCYMSWMGTVLLYTQKHKYSFLDKAAPKAQETMFVFDHELGHALIPNALYNDGRNKAECIADAYGVIRHLQRYGADSAVIDVLVQQRALQFIFRRDRASHLTSPVTEQILARRHEIAWDSLTPAETQQLAWRFAMEYAVQPILLDSIDKDFKKFQGKLDNIEKGDVAPLQELAAKVLTTSSPDVFKYGAMALKFCLDGQLANVVLSGEYWDNLRQQLAEKQKIFAAQDKLMFGLGSNDNLPSQQNSTDIVVDYTPLMKFARQPPKP
ncbi:MAG: hypothetical protein K8R48_07960 [Alphaproteobacteria bacterium]|nr:hypothetical protein [Alphaproteobacteria bacterium]